MAMFEPDLGAPLPSRVRPLAGAAALAIALGSVTARADGGQPGPPPAAPAVGPQDAPASPAPDGSAGGLSPRMPDHASGGFTPGPLPPWETEPRTRRSGFMVGTMLGFGVSSIAGFPNDVTEINLASYYTVTGVRPTSAFSLWLGAALSDWLNFGVGFSGGGMFATGENQATAGGLIFHLEAFPFFPLGGRWRDLGVIFDAGTGSASVAPKNDTTDKLVDSGSASSLGLGAFYDGVRFWRFGSGPALFGNYMWSDSVRRPAIFLGWRMAFYADKIKLAEPVAGPSTAFR
jgi:hypothetical protein